MSHELPSILVTLPPYGIYFIADKPSSLEDGPKHSIEVPSRVAERSPYLRTQIKPPPTGLNKLHFELPEVYVSAFKLYIGWLDVGYVPFPYYGPLHIPPKSLLWRDCFDLVRAHILGSRFNHAEFQDFVMDELDRWLDPRQELDSQVLEYIFAEKDVSMELKCFVVDKMMALEKDALEVMRVFANRVLEGKCGNVNLGRSCEYHAHSPGHCPRDLKKQKRCEIADPAVLSSLIAIEGQAVQVASDVGEEATPDGVNAHMNARMQSSEAFQAQRYKELGEEAAEEPIEPGKQFDVEIMNGAEEKDTGHVIEGSVPRDMSLKTKRSPTAMAESWNFSSRFSINRSFEDISLSVRPALGSQPDGRFQPPTSRLHPAIFEGLDDLIAVDTEVVEESAADLSHQVESALPEVVADKPLPPLPAALPFPSARYLHSAANHCLVQSFGHKGTILPSCDMERLPHARTFREQYSWPLEVGTRANTIRRKPVPQRGLSIIAERPNASRVWERALSNTIPTKQFTIRRKPVPPAPIEL